MYKKWSPRLYRIIINRIYSALFNFTYPGHVLRVERIGKCCSYKNDTTLLKIYAQYKTNLGYKCYNEVKLTYKATFHLIISIYTYKVG